MEKTYVIDSRTVMDPDVTRATEVIYDLVRNAPPNLQIGIIIQLTGRVLTQISPTYADTLQSMKAISTLVLEPMEMAIMARDLFKEGSPTESAALMETLTELADKVSHGLIPHKEARERARQLFAQQVKTENVNEIVKDI
jgi:hypothetical protein